MKPLRLTAMIVLLAWSACARAQMPHVNMMPDDPTKTQDQIEQEKERDKAYKETMKKIPDAKAPTDPWGNVRSGDAPKAAPAPNKAASAKSKTKTGNNAN